MNAFPALPSGPGRRWWLAVLAAVVVQFALVLLLAEPAPPPVRSAAREPHVSLGPLPGNELTALLNPTLFVWGGAHSVSAETWRLGGTRGHPPLRYSEPPQFLALAARDLSGIATLLASEPDASAPPAPVRRGPAPTVVTEALGSTTLPGQSTYELTGELADRQLPTASALPALPAADVLAETTVQICVDAAGRLQSSTLLARSGLPAADGLALEFVRALRFAPLPGVALHPVGPVLPLVHGEVVFRWQTVAP